MFKPRAHYVFNYKPRYYNERKERLDKLKKQYDKENKISSKDAKISISKENLKADWKREKKIATEKGVNRRLALIIAILVGILAYFFELHKLF